MFAQYKLLLLYDTACLIIYFHAFLQMNVTNSINFLRDQFLTTPRTLQNFILFKQLRTFQITTISKINFSVSCARRGCKKNLYAKPCLLILARLLKYKIKNLDMLHISFHQSL